MLTLDYSATGFSLAADGRTHLFAQLVDRQRNLVVNNQATPVPIELDGQAHEITIPLERIASLGTAAGYELELIPQTTMYDAQRRRRGPGGEREIEIPLAAPVSRRQPAQGDGEAEAQEEEEEEEEEEAQAALAGA